MKETTGKKQVCALCGAAEEDWAAAAVAPEADDGD